jgi:hypothetical protein
MNVNPHHKKLRGGSMDISSEQGQAVEQKAAPSQGGDRDVAVGRDLVDQLPPAIAPLFSNPPVLKTEDPKAYRELLNEVAATMRPTDLVEFLWLRDFTDLTWEILRYRRLQKAILETGELAGLRNRFRDLIHDGHLSQDQLDRNAAALAVSWCNPDSRAALEKARPNQIKDEYIAAEAFVHRIKELESIDKLLSAAESRRNKVLREIDYRRVTRAYRAKLAEIAARSPEATEVEIKTLPGQPTRRMECGKPDGDAAANSSQSA